MRMSDTTALTALLAAGALALTACGGGAAEDGDPAEGSAAGATTSAASASDAEESTSASPEAESSESESGSPEPGDDASSSPASDAADSTDVSEPASASPSESGSAGADATEAGPGLSDNPPRWGFPLDTEGWELSVWDQNGINQIKNSEGCLFTSSQNRVQPDPDKSAREASEDLAKEFDAGLSGAVAESDFTHSDGEIHLITGGTTEAIQVAGTYANAQGEEFETTFLGRVFPDQQSWVSLQYACPSDAYDEEEMAALFQATVLDQAEPRSFDG